MNPKLKEFLGYLAAGFVFVIFMNTVIDAIFRWLTGR